MKSVARLMVAAMPLAASQSISTGYNCGVVQSATWTVANGTRSLVSNSMPQHTVADYCPFGAGGSYCGTFRRCPTGNYTGNGANCYPSNWGDAEWPQTGNTTSGDGTGSPWGQIASDVSAVCRDSSWTTISCPYTAAATGAYECPVAKTVTMSITTTPLPVMQSVGPGKVQGSSCGVALNGVPLWDSFEADGLTIDQARMVNDVCNGHPTPGQAGGQYHYHKAPVCANAATGDASPYSEIPGTHSPQLAWALDGFPIYGFQDHGGSGAACMVSVDAYTAAISDDCTTADETCHCGGGRWTGDNLCKTTGQTGTCERKPVTDSCNGHFGPTLDNPSELNYHYHGSATSPYTAACFGPSWGKCSTLYTGNRAAICKTDCEDANKVSISGSFLCVATGYTTLFNASALVFGSGYTSTTGGGGGGGGGGLPSKAPTAAATTKAPTASPTTKTPTTAAPTTAAPTGTPTTGAPTGAPTTGSPTIATPATGAPVTGSPTTGSPTTGAPVTGSPTTGAPVTGSPTTGSPTTTTAVPTQRSPPPLLPGQNPPPPPPPPRQLGEEDEDDMQEAEIGPSGEVEMKAPKATYVRDSLSGM